MLFIEAPVGVGFSYSDDTSYYTTNDKKTAAGNYRLIVGFFERFPQFKTNEFVVSSESYGGEGARVGCSGWD